LRTNIKFIELVHAGVRQASEELIKRNETLINKYSRQNGKLNDLISL